MLNQLVIVGRIIEKPIVEKTENGKEVSIFTLAVPRPYKGVDGEYETDLIPIFLTPGLTENTIPYCKKGKLIGVKARLENRNNKLQVTAEKVTFLSTIDK